MVSISGCDPLDPGSNPGTAIFISLFILFLVPYKIKESATHLCIRGRVVKALRSGRSPL